MTQPTPEKRKYKRLAGREKTSIREAYHEFGLSCLQLAEWYGVSHTTVLRVVNDPPYNKEGTQ